MNEESTHLSLSPMSTPTTQTPFQNVHLTHTPIWSSLMEVKSMKESIVDSKCRYQHLHYLVKFKGWPDSNNEWLPANHLANAPNIVQDFHLCYPSAPTPHHMSCL